MDKAFTTTIVLWNFRDATLALFLLLTQHNVVGFFLFFNDTKTLIIKHF